MKIKALKIVNSILALLFILILISLIWYKTTDSGSAVEMHEICGLLFALFALVHIWLNRIWIKANIFHIKPAK